MKFSFTITLLLLCLFTVALTKHHHRLRSGLTPKGTLLANHFGTSKLRNTYGPSTPIDLKNLMVQTSSGAWTNLQNQYGDAITQTGHMCDITKNGYYAMCQTINQCDLCGAAAHCGWCQSTQTCLPGSISECACTDACPKNWLFDNQRCVSNLKSGDLSNISPDATGLINPEIATPKIKITQDTRSYSVEKIPVVVGQRTERREVTALVKSQNRVINGEVDINVPIVMDILQPVLKVEKVVRHVDPNTGAEIMPDTVLVYHGINDTVIVPPTTDSSANSTSTATA